MVCRMIDSCLVDNILWREKERYYYMNYKEWLNNKNENINNESILLSICKNNEKIINDSLEDFQDRLASLVEKNIKSVERCNALNSSSLKSFSGCIVKDEYDEEYEVLKKEMELFVKKDFLNNMISKLLKLEDLSKVPNFNMTKYKKINSNIFLEFRNIEKEIKIFEKNYNELVFKATDFAKKACIDISFLSHPENIEQQDSV